MAVLQLISLLCIVGVFAYGKDDVYEYDDGPTKCYSRFDYDHKVLTKLVTLETALARMQDATKFETATRGSATGGCCPDGWTVFMGSCYYFTHDDTKTFVEAQTYCRLSGGHLVHVNNEMENSFIKNNLKHLVATNYWMGLTDAITEGTFVWTDTDTPPTFTDYYRGEPNGGTGENCIVFFERCDYQWVDLGCNQKTQAVCEMSMTT